LLCKRRINLIKLDLPAPVALLGGPEDPEDIGNCSAPETKLVPGSHTDSVLSLSWNTHQKNLIASGSADTTVKLWDLNNGRCLKTFTNSNKVSSVLWNPVEASVLACGCYGGSLVITDARVANGGLTTKLSSDIECITWIPAPHHNHIFAGTEDGNLTCYDIVHGLNKPLWKIKAHKQATQCISISPNIPGMLATGSTDTETSFRIWDISAGKPVCLFTSEQPLEVYSLKFSEDDPYLLALGIKHKRPMFVDTRLLQSVYARFHNK